MKKLLFAMFAFALCLGITSCKDEAGKKEKGEVAAASDEKSDAKAVSLADIVAEAKANGSNWSVDEWKAQFKAILNAAKPMMTELKSLQEEAEKAGDDTAKASELMGKMAEVMKKYEPDLKALDEFETVCEASENGKKVLEDEEFQKEMEKEFPEFADM